MRSRILKLSVLAVLMLSFVAVGCDADTCKSLKAQLNNLVGDIERIAEERRKVDAEGKDMGRAMELFQEEQNLRNRFASTAADYIAKGCEERTGGVPPLPPMMPVTETAFE